MNEEEKVILSKLLKKYSDSKSFITGEERRRPVILKFDSSSFPQYNYEDYEIKERFYIAVKNLEQQDLIFVNYRKGVFHLIEEVRLNTDNVNRAYNYIGEVPLIDKIENVKLRLKKSLNICSIDWLKSFFEIEIEKLDKRNKLLGLWKNDIRFIDEVLIALDSLSKSINSPITQRVFSIKCYHNSKHFERVIQKDIVQIIKNNEPTIKEMLETETEISDRAVLAQVGIILRAEVFEFCGNITFETTHGICDFSALKNGACIRSETVNEIKNIYFDKAINKIVFIENKTNYDEYILKDKSNNELVIYHGGFYSPQKASFFKTIKNFMPENINCVFWSDIDYGGFKMFTRLKEIFDCLQPIYMDKCTYTKYYQYGLEHSDKYFENLSKLLDDKNYEIFYDVIKEILIHKKTVEQEVLLGNQ